MFNPVKFKNKRALVLGAGKSGIACANLLASQGFKVLLSENRPLESVRAQISELSRDVQLETGGHTSKIFSCGFAIKSPGLSSASPLLHRLKERRIPVFSEVETALAFCKTKELLAVTGTNGKTTTTMLLGAIMRRHLRPGTRKAWICGNVGTPASELLAKAASGDAVIMELSSYQLEDSSFIHPAAACILNITPDHIDHHGTMKAYIMAKARIFRAQKKRDICVLNADDPLCMKLAKLCPGTVLLFSSSRPEKRLNAWHENGRIYFKVRGREMSAVPPSLPGRHNIENAMCAGLMALSRGVSSKTIATIFKTFKGVEHRIEPVRTLKGINFINDSKATNVDSTLTALNALGTEQKKIWLILGGLDKGTPYAPLMPRLKSSAKAVLTIGAAANRINKELKSCCPVINVRTLPRAIKYAQKKGSAGDIVLLSPACASFDQFKDFEDRGRKFKALVNGL